MAKKRKKTAAQEARELEVIERGAHVIELRKSGASYRKIAAILKEKGEADVSYQTVRRHCIEALEILGKHLLEETLQYRQLQVERFEAILLANYAQAIGKAEPVLDPETKQPVIDEQTGKPKLKITPPSIPHGELARKIINDLNDMFDFKSPQKLELTKPVEVVGLSVAEWRKQSAARRAEAAKTLKDFSEDE